ncbi:hypothetical protein D3C86_1260330 [compost metagenome]
MYTLITQEHENSTTESREVESLQLCLSIGERGGFYKVQIIDSEWGTVIHEFKNDNINTTLQQLASDAIKREEVEQSATLYKHILIECENKNDEAVSLVFYVYVSNKGRFGWNTKPQHVKDGCNYAGNYYCTSIADKFSSFASCMDDIADHLAYRHDILRTVSTEILGKYMRAHNIGM